MGEGCNCSFLRPFKDVDGSIKCLVCHGEISSQYLKEVNEPYRKLVISDESESSKEQYLREWFGEAQKEIKLKDQRIKQLEDALRDAFITIKGFGGRDGYEKVNMFLDRNKSIIETLIKERDA